MKTEEGLVLTVNGNTAKVKAGRHSSCNNCGACPGDSTLIISAANQKGAKPGERVEFEIKETNTLLAAFVVFICPILITLFGVAAGWLASKYMYGGSSLWETVLGILFFMLSLGMIKSFNHSISEKEQYQPKIIRIL